MQIPAYTYESKAADIDAPTKFYERIAKTVVENITVGDLLGLSGELRKEVVENIRTVRVPTQSSSKPSATSLFTEVDPRDIELEYHTPLRELKVTIKGKEEDALLDEGSEIVVIRKDLWEEMGLKINVE
ncbi:hypothetical protein H0H93_002117, partial [Arthromyces matolae]